MIDTTYAASYPLPPCRVERELLSSLEEYLLERAQQLLSLCSPEEAKYASSTFDLKIRDSKGQEDLQSAQDYRLPYYPNDTNRIALRVSARGGNRNMVIGVTFDVEAWASTLDLSYTGADSKEIVEGFAAGVLLRVKLYRNSILTTVVRPRFAIEAIVIGAHNDGSCVVPQPVRYIRS